MKNNNRSQSIIVALLIVVVGILMIIADVFWLKTVSNVWVSIGCSLLASALVILLTTWLVDKPVANPLDEWGVAKIYATRAEKNADSDPKLVRAKYQVDAVAFGLKHFRTDNQKRVEDCLRKGVNFRILTMDPESPYIVQRSIEEGDEPEHIKNSVKQLIAWANTLNRNTDGKGKIIIQGYSCMTLDFYWRVDNEIYVGPYWYGVDRQKTITMKFVDGGKAFEQYSEYFEKLWQNKQLVRPLTEVTEFVAKRKYKRS